MNCAIVVVTISIKNVVCSNNMKYYRPMPLNDANHYCEFRFTNSEMRVMPVDLQLRLLNNRNKVHPEIHSSNPTVYRVSSCDENLFCNEVIWFYKYAKDRGFNISKYL